MNWYWPRHRPNYRMRADLLYTRISLDLSGSSDSTSMLSLTVMLSLRSLRAGTEISKIFVVCYLSSKRGARGRVDRGSGATGLGGEAVSIECAGRMGPVWHTVATQRDLVRRSSKK